MARSKSEDWVSVVEAAKRLGVTRGAIYKAIQTGRLKARLKTITRRVMNIDPTSLADFSVSESHQRRGKRAARTRRAQKR